MRALNTIGMLMATLYELVTAFSYAYDNTLLLVRQQYYMQIVTLLYAYDKTSYRVIKRFVCANTFLRV